MTLDGLFGFLQTQIIIILIFKFLIHNLILKF